MQPSLWRVGSSRGIRSPELKKLWANMRFASVPLAEDLGVEAKLPFLDPRFRALAENLDVRLKVRNHGGQMWGKWVLRKASEKLIPPDESNHPPGDAMGKNGKSPFAFILVHEIPPVPWEREDRAQTNSLSISLSSMGGSVLLGTTTISSPRGSEVR